jgi:hypothetical protein
MKDYAWIFGVFYLILVVAFFMWVFLDPASFQDWWNVDEGLLPSYP